MTTSTETGQRSFVHSALFYHSQREFLDYVVGFVLDGLALDEPVLVYLSAYAVTGTDGKVALLPGDAKLDDFVVKALAEKLGGSDVFRIVLMAFLDVYNFDVRRVMKCCLAHVLPSGHVVPFCAYNTLYRDGHVPLPPLTDGAAQDNASVRSHASPSRRGAIAIPVLDGEHGS